MRQIYLVELPAMRLVAKRSGNGSVVRSSDRKEVHVRPTLCIFGPVEVSRFTQEQNWAKCGENERCPMEVSRFIQEQDLAKDWLRKIPPVEASRFTQ